MIPIIVLALVFILIIVRRIGKFRLQIWQIMAVGAIAVLATLQLFPLVSINGILIIDYYGYWAGSQKAVDEYFSKKPILLNRIDDIGVIGTKSMDVSL
jgi:hypothetical protein